MHVNKTIGHRIPSKAKVQDVPLQNFACVGWRWGARALGVEGDVCLDASGSSGTPPSSPAVTKSEIVMPRIAYW